MAISPDKNAMDTEANADYSEGLWQLAHDEQFKGPFRNQDHLSFDAFTRPMFKTVQRAVDDWLADQEEADKPVDKSFAAKVNFNFSDLTRWAFFNRRLVQTLHKLNPNAPPAYVEASPWEFTVAVRWWFRQLALD